MLCTRVCMHVSGMDNRVSDPFDPQNPASPVPTKLMDLTKSQQLSDGTDLMKNGTI